MDDRRKHPRVNVVPADLRVTTRQSYSIVSIADISVGGMKIEITGSAPKVGELLDVTLALPGGDTKVNAMVRHVSTAGDPTRFFIGVEFDDPDLIDRVAGDWIISQLRDQVTRVD